ncbi:hypothetical protein DFH09DRAFT_1093261 [Mycena vulgaris]|nr:hypothetical protein DFH09DRAFT_1093261 [Mycena vulgaris]
MSDITLRPATSPELKAECISIRKTEPAHPAMIFFSEDAVALHFLLADSAKIEGGFIGTAHLLARSEDTYVISRFALLPPLRRGGNGVKLIQTLEQWILRQKGFHVVVLEAQDGSCDFTKSYEASLVRHYMEFHSLCPK